MNFVDTAKVVVSAGAGGMGAVSFRREKFIDKGGPDGGDGGNGGSVVFQASESENTLANFRYQKELAAEAGQPGGKNRRHGKNGEDLLTKVPVGTQILEGKKLLADLTTSGQRATIANGGRGGFGNAHFVSSIRQAPKFAEKGEPGETKKLALELKMIADVGLVGLPNAGKSTLLARLSNARPEIADYPFTTLTPNLGVVDIDSKNSLLFADIPGLIEGAASGKGLGHEFLRHVERTAVLVHLIDAYQADIASAYKTIQTELANYQVNLASRPQIVALSKTEGLSASETNQLVNKLKKLAPKAKILAISANAGQNLAELKRLALAEVKKFRASEKTSASKAQSSLSSSAGGAAEPETNRLPIIRLADSSPGWQIEKTDDGWQVTGEKIEKFAARTDFSNTESVARLKDIMRKQGILHELARRGALAGDIISISGGALKY